MPDSETFKIKPINDLINSHITDGLWVDPFSFNSVFGDRCITNDLNPLADTDHHLEAIDFLSLFGESSVDGALFDPPYSPRQISECYKKIGREVHAQDTQSGFYGDRKKALSRVIRKGGKVLSFGWNSGGIGKSNGFQIVEILMVPHGGSHYDTICTVEIKV